MRPIAVFMSCLYLPSLAIAGVLEDFELGSGGIKLTQVDLTLRIFIYALMCVFVAWVLYNSLKEVIDAGPGEYYPIAARILRSFLLCVVVILTIT